MMQTKGSIQRNFLKWASLSTLFVTVGAGAATRIGQQWASFDAVLDADRTVAIDLTGHPALIQDARFLAVHPDLGHYFAAHPEVQAALAASPDLLVVRERRFLAAGIDKADLQGNRLKRTSLDWFDSYLSVHADLERALRQNPSLIDAPQTLSQSPDLARMLKADPAFAPAFKQHPGAYLNRIDDSADGPNTTRSNP